MNDAKKAALAAIDEKKALVAEVADAIWDYAELSMQEVKSAGRSSACWRSTTRCPAFRRRQAAPRTTSW